MEKTESIVELAKALTKMQGALKSVPKKSSNPFFNSKYADLDACWEVCRKPMADNGLSLVQTTVELQSKIYLETMLLHQSGEWLRCLLPINALKQDPQGVGSAITYARRYAMSAMLGISAEEDDDGEGAMDRKGQAKKETKAADAKPPSAGEPAHWCAEHKCAYRKFEKEGRTWYSHKNPDESWCNETKKQAPKPPVENFVEGDEAEFPHPEATAKPAPEQFKVKAEPEDIAQLRGKLNYLLNNLWPVAGKPPAQIAEHKAARTAFLAAYEVPDPAKATPLLLQVAIKALEKQIAEKPQERMV